jgi:Rhodopirellula transposase DDE domain
VETDATLLVDLERLIDPVTRGDPESPLRWTCKSIRNLAEELERLGHATSHPQGPGRPESGRAGHLG